MHIMGSEKRFFNLWRDVLVESMTLVEILPKGSSTTTSRRAVPSACGWSWGRTCSSSPIHGARARKRFATGFGVGARISGAGRAPAWFPEEPSHPVYAAKEDADTGDLFVASFHRGDWCGLASQYNCPLPPARNQLLIGWPESHRGRIAELAKDRASQQS